MADVINLSEFLTEGLDPVSLTATASSDSDQIYCTSYGGCSVVECSNYTGDGCPTYSSCSSYSTCTTYSAPVAPSFYIDTPTSNGVNVYVSHGYGYNYFRVFCRLASNTSDSTYNAANLYHASDFTQVVSGLSPNTTYVVNVGYNSDNGDSWAWCGGVTFTTAQSTATFSWTYAGIDTAGEPVAGNTKTAGLGIYVAAAEWNALVALVNSKKGTSISTVTSGTTITATIVNQVASALGVATVSNTTNITAAFFNNLMNAINAS